LIDERVDNPRRLARTRTAKHEHVLRCLVTDESDSLARVDTGAVVHRQQLAGRFSDRQHERPLFGVRDQERRNLSAAGATPVRAVEGGRNRKRRNDERGPREPPREVNLRVGQERDLPRRACEMSPVRDDDAAHVEVYKPPRTRQRLIEMSVERPSKYGRITERMGDELRGRTKRGDHPQDGDQQCDSRDRAGRTFRPVHRLMRRRGPDLRRPYGNLPVERGRARTRCRSLRRDHIAIKLTLPAF